MQASSIVIITAGVAPCIRIKERIMVLHMSAQFMHAGAQSIICVEQTVHACSQAEHASMHACMTAMSIACMPGMAFMSADIAPIIIESTAHRFRQGFRRRERAGDPPDVSVIRFGTDVDDDLGRPGPGIRPRA
jgi:hypothetical protein